MELGYIYTITNKVSGKVYVGQAVDYEDRWGRHKRELRGNYHNNQHLQNSYNKHGAEAFEYKVIDAVPIETLDEAEIAYIAQYDSFKNGYNGTLGGDGIRGFTHTEEAIHTMQVKSRARWCDDSYIKKQKEGYSEEVRTIMSDKKVGEKHPRAKLTNAVRIAIYKDTVNTDSYWTERYDISRATVSLIRTGQRSGKLTQKLNDDGFYHPLHLKRLGLTSPPPPKNEWMDIVKEGEEEQSNKPCKWRKVVQISANTGDAVKVWDNAVMATNGTRFTVNGIIKCCNGKSNLHRGWIWKYYEGAE
jgi:group I intron endonuclease